MTLDLIEEKLGEAHGLAIAASSLTGTVARHVDDWTLRAVLDDLRRDADETRRRCLALERSLGSDPAGELLAHANTTAQHVGDLVAAWFKAGTDEFRAWCFLVMGEAGELAAWKALAELTHADDGALAELARWGERLQARHLELALEGVPRLAQRAGFANPGTGDVEGRSKSRRKD